MKRAPRLRRCRCCPVGRGWVFPPGRRAVAASVLKRGTPQRTTDQPPVPTVMRPAEGEVVIATW